MWMMLNAHLSGNFEVAVRGLESGTMLLGEVPPLPPPLGSAVD